MGIDIELHEVWPDPQARTLYGHSRINLQRTGGLLTAISDAMERGEPVPAGGFHREEDDDPTDLAASGYPAVMLSGQALCDAMHKAGEQFPLGPWNTAVAEFLRLCPPNVRFVPYLI